MGGEGFFETGKHGMVRVVIIKSYHNCNSFVFGHHHDSG